MTDFDNYQFEQYDTMVKELAMFKRVMDEALWTSYCGLGLCGESGEVADKLKKVYRDNNGVFDDANKESIILELGDVLFYVTALAQRFDVTLQEVAIANEKKLRKRKAEGKIHGSGDHR